MKAGWNATLKQAEEFLATLTDEGKFENAIDKYNDKTAEAQKLNMQHIEIST